jgi:amidase
MDSVIALLKARGAVIVDPANIPSVVDTVAANNFTNWNPCSGLEQAKGRDADCSIAFKYGMKRDFDTWLKSLGAKAPVKTLTELRQWNIAHQRAGSIKYGQANLDVSDEMNLQAGPREVRGGSPEGHPALGDERHRRGPEGESARRPALPRREQRQHWSAAGLSDRYGAVRAAAGARGTGANAFPAGFEPKPAPFGVSFTGTACSEPKLITLAYAFEQATKKRTPPPLFP